MFYAFWRLNTEAKANWGGTGQKVTGTTNRVCSVQWTAAKTWKAGSLSFWIKLAVYVPVEILLRDKSHRDLLYAGTGKLPSKWQYFTREQAERIERNHTELASIEGSFHQCLWGLCFLNPFYHVYWIHFYWLSSCGGEDEDGPASKRMAWNKTSEQR